MAAIELRKFKCCAVAAAQWPRVSALRRVYTARFRRDGPSANLRTDGIPATTTSSLVSLIFISVEVLFILFDRSIRVGAVSGASRNADPSDNAHELEE